jgi:hypothetical protein
MRLVFRRRIQHPYYPELKPAPAVETTERAVSLFGTFAELSHAAATGVQVGRAVFPLLSPANPFLGEEQRDALWGMFEVPVLPLLVDHGGHVIGYECELQAGFHMREDFRAGMLLGRTEEGLCDCGRAGVRLMPPVRQGALAAAPD